MEAVFFFSGLYSAFFANVMTIIMSMIGAVIFFAYFSVFNQRTKDVAVGVILFLIYCLVFVIKSFNLEEEILFKSGEIFMMLTGANVALIVSYSYLSL